MASKRQITQKDKRTGIEYVYESESYWDKEKKQTRYKSRRLIGQIDKATGATVANRPTKASPSGPSARRALAGATYLFDEVCTITGIADDLMAVFPKDYKSILSLAYYLVCEDKSPLSRFGHWSRLHTHPLGQDITSQQSSRLFASIGLADAMRFFALRTGREDKGGYWYYDTTSISSYSQVMRLVRWGKNKDGDSLAQLNVGVVYSAVSALPVSFRRTAGNIADVSTLKRVIAENKAIDAKAVRLCMDRGFYSKTNIDAMMAAHMKFLIGTKTSLKYVKEAIKEHAAGLRQPDCLDLKKGIYGLKVPFSWDFEHAPLRKDRTASAPKRAYLHLFYSPVRAIEDETVLNTKLRHLADELGEGRRVAGHEDSYERYFTIVRKKPVANTDVIDAEKELFGYFALLTNDASLSPHQALAIYRRKDLIEKAFCDIKDRLDFKTPRVSNMEALDGKLFCVFVALIIISWLKDAMSKAGLSKDWTVQGLIDELDSIERYESEGHLPRVMTVTKKQHDIYEALGIKPLGVS